MKKIALISDVRGWAFDVNLKALAKYVLPDTTKWEVHHFYVGDLKTGWMRTPKKPEQIKMHKLLGLVPPEQPGIVPTHGWPPSFEDWDVVFTPYHRWKQIENRLRWDNTLGSLRSSMFWPEMPGPPTQDDIDLVNRYAAFHVVTQKNYEELKDHCPRVVYLTNPVDTEHFDKCTPVYNCAVFSWTGNAHHSGPTVKGYFDLIKPVFDRSRAPFVMAEYGSKRIPHEDMPGFFLRGNVTVCMSLYEGASNSVMEAMACGHALITTDVGNAREMHDSQIKHFGESGIMFVERTTGALWDAVVALRKDPKRAQAMGQLNREEIRQRWSWHAWKDRYTDFIHAALPTH